MRTMMRRKGSLSQVAVSEAYFVSKNRALSVRVMVQDGGYEKADPNITEQNFPIRGGGSVEEEEVLLANFGREIESDDVVRKMNALGLEPSPIEDVLAFGAQHPDVQREHYVVGLGSWWSDPNGIVHVPVLDGWSAGRGLHLVRRDDGWFGAHWFLVRRKSHKRP